MKNTALLESYLNCHVCSETFRDPVSLSCNHSFCSSCLHKFWEQANNKNCPICKTKSLTDEPAVNFALKELADNFAGRQKSGSSETGKEKKKEEVVCDEHPEVPYWFCKDEDRVVCPVCEFSLHHGHTVVPVEQAVRDLKEQLKSDLQSLQDKRDKHRRVEETYDEITHHSKKQLLSTESQIRAEFNKLHQFLKEEKESRLAALREEEQQRGKTVSREMKRIQEQISSLSDSISAVEADLQKDSVPFLSSYKASQSRARVQCSLSDPQLLCLSDDLTSVRRETQTRSFQTIQRDTAKYSSVLGSEGFSSGKHSWEVEVGDHPDWNVGLAKESADRKGERCDSPKYGIWCLLYGSGEYTDGSGMSVTVKKSLQRIRVQLDYEGGEVSFYNSEDKTHIYTHRDTFTEKLFPYFSIAEAGDAKTTEIKICPAEICL
uniref:Nuclear factor 7, brain-like n=1 Tax=Sander lucioperca TaxID=283035 RepID=A0A8C9YRH2_SANLU